MNKNWGYQLTRGRVSRQSQRVRRWMQPFQLKKKKKKKKKTLIRHSEKYLHTMMLKLTEHVDITIFLSYKQKPDEILIFRTFIAKFWIFVYFSQNIAIFRSGMFLWRHNYVTPWPIVLILVCLNREGPYLPIDTKINFIGGLVRIIWGVATNPLG